MQANKKYVYLQPKRNRAFQSMVLKIGASLGESKNTCQQFPSQSDIMIPEFNLIATTARGNERPMINEILYLLKEEVGDAEAQAAKTKVRGVIVAKTTLDPLVAIEKFHLILKERPYELRYALRILPIQKVVPTTIEEVKKTTAELALNMGEKETFRVTVEKRFTTLHTKDLIEAAAGDIKNKVNLENPDRILLIEILGALTGVSLLKPRDILAVVKEKML
jgi:tRNA acetyltransferase TAN1